jgi:hypothetical protein
MRSGFLALTGVPFGTLTITRGLGGFGTGLVEPVVEEGAELPRPAPRAVPENKKAPTALVYQPMAKKKRGR